MLITRTPLRASLLGGGTDLPSVYRRDGGAAVGAAISAWVDVVVRSRAKVEGPRFVIACGGYETASDVDAIDHPIVRETLRFLGHREALEVHSLSCVAAGTGLGSSSSFAVGLLHALRTLRGDVVTPMQVAQDAFHVEAERLGRPIGKQDHVFAAFGGLRELRFAADDSVHTRALSAAAADRLQSMSLLFQLPGTRSSADVLKSLGLASDRKREALALLRDSVAHLVRELETSGTPESVGAILHEGWLLKRSLGASSPAVDAVYERARAHGSLGGKLLGAGHTGVLLLVAPPENHQEMCRALVDLRALDFRIDHTGSRVLVRSD